MNYCKNCGLICGNRNKFCKNDTCFQTYHDNKRIERWNTEKNFSSTRMKKVLISWFGNKCSECSITEWNNKPIVVELEHKNGNSDDNSIENVCLLCPNCHSQTPTYKGRNKGHGRHNRMIRYNEGKSF